MSFQVTLYFFCPWAQVKGLSSYTISTDLVIPQNKELSALGRPISHFFSFHCEQFNMFNKQNNEKSYVFS